METLNKIFRERWFYGTKYSRISKICGRQPLKNLKGWWDMVCLSRPYPFKLFKGCLPQILLGPFMNTLSHMQRLGKLQMVLKSLLTYFKKL